jgi:hypothetical protein
MVYAQIKQGAVWNTIVLNDEKLIGLFAEGYDYFIDITNMVPQPCIGWYYDGTNFSDPNGIG